MGLRGNGEITGALREAHGNVAKLAMPEPDPDEYDRGFNEGIRRACDTIRETGLALNAERERRAAIDRTKRETIRRERRLRRASMSRRAKFRTLEDIEIDD